jgi:hypothetical protein
MAERAEAMQWGTDLAHEQVRKRRCLEPPWLWKRFSSAIPAISAVRPVVGRRRVRSGNAGRA